MRTPSNVRALRAAWRAANGDVSRETSCFRIDNTTDVPKLYVYDLIGGWDLDALEFVQAVHGITGDAIDLFVNSPGGFVYDAVAMYEALRAHPATVTTNIDGLAGSAASFLALAGDKVKIAKAGRMMIHDAQLVAIGSPDEIREMADVGDAVSDDIAGIYAERAGGKAATWRTAMRATTWYSAEQAVGVGLAHSIAGKTSGPDNRTRLIQARHSALTTLGG